MARSLISPRLMRTLRALDERAMPDSVTIERPGAPVPNGRGGETPGAPATVTVPCRIVDGVGDEADADALRLAQAEGRLFCPVSADIRETDAIITQVRDGATIVGRWRVVHAPAPTSLQADRVVGIKKG